MKQIIRRTCCAGLTLLFSMHAPIANSGAMPYGSPYGNIGAPGANFGMNEGDMLNMLEELENEIAKLSPEEKKNFDQMVEAFGESLMTMSDDDFDRFITGNMAEDEIIDRFGHIGPQKKEEAQTEEKVEEAKPAEPIVEVKPPSKESIQASTMIESIITRTESLVRKMPPDISFRLNTWLNNKELAHWQPTLEWTTFEKDLEAFKAKLAQIRDDRNAERQKTYIDALLANKQLYNNLDQLRAILEKHEGQLGERSLVLKASSDLKPQEATALRTMLDKYAEALYKLKVSEEIDSILKAYEQTEKKLLAAEESAQKKAEQYRGPQRGRTEIAGIAGDAGYATPPYSDLDSLGRGLRDPYSTGDYGRTPYRPETSAAKTEAPKEEPKGPLSRLPKGKGKKGATAPKKGKTVDAKKKADEGAKKKEEAAAAKKPLTAAKEAKVVDEVFNLVTEASNDITAAQQAIAPQGGNATFAQYVRDNTPPATNQGGADLTALENINKAAQRMALAAQKCGQLSEPSKQQLKQKLESNAITLQTLRGLYDDAEQISRQAINTPRSRWYTGGACSTIGPAIERGFEELTRNPNTQAQVQANWENALAENLGLENANQLPDDAKRKLQDVLGRIANKELAATDLQQLDSLLNIRCKLTDLAQAIAQLNRCLGGAILAAAQAQPAAAAPGQQAGPPPVPADVDGQPADDLQGGAGGEERARAAEMAEAFGEGMFEGLAEPREAEQRERKREQAEARGGRLRYFGGAQQQQGQEQAAPACPLP